MTAILEDQTGAVKQRFATVTNVDPGAFADDRVVVTVRPEPAPWPFTMMIASFGLGAVICVEEKYADWARAGTPSGRNESFFLGYALEREVRGRGEALNAGPPILGWALAAHPKPTAVPEGFHLETVDAAWMNEWKGRSLFTNALGLPEQAHRTFRNQFAAVAFDSTGVPAAVAGAYDTAGLLEIGVDVSGPHQGKGLATAVVSDVTAAILDRRQTPFYECAVTNIRSQRTALSSGFMPVCTTALVYEAGLGLSS